MLSFLVVDSPAECDSVSSVAPHPKRQSKRKQREGERKCAADPTSEMYDEVKECCLLAERADPYRLFLHPVVKPWRCKSEREEEATGKRVYVDPDLFGWQRLTARNGSCQYYFLDKGRAR